MRDKYSMYDWAQAPLTRRDLLQITGAAGAAASLVPWSKAFSETQSPKSGGTLTVACPSAKSIDPVTMIDTGGIALAQQVVEYLVWINPDLTLRPVLATHWHTLDRGKTWIFNLRKGVKFHTGKEMTADDVVTSFNRLMDPDVPSTGKTQIPFLKKGNTKKVDKYTVKFMLDHAVGKFPNYLNTFSAVILPSDYSGNFASNPVGTGPFKLTNYKAGHSASFEKNEDYWAHGKPYLDSVEVGLYNSPQAQILALQGGKADMMVAISPVDARPLLGNSDIKISDQHSPATRLLAMRTDQPPFNDVRVRRAIALCIEREAMIKVLLSGKGVIANDHPVAPIYHNKIELPQRDRNIEKAKKLLRDAGHPNGIKLTLHVPNYLELPKFGVMTKSALQAANIDVALKVETYNSYYNHWATVDFGLTDWIGRPTPGQILRQAFGGDSEWNASHWKNAHFDKITRELVRTIDSKRRDDLANRAAKILYDEVPAVIVYFNDTLRPMRREVMGVTTNLSQYLDLSSAWLRI